MAKIVWDESTLVKLANRSDAAKEILLTRGLSKTDVQAFLNPNYESGLQSPSELPDIDEAIKRIKDAIKKHQLVVIYGDYDIDGLTATALLNDALTAMGARVEMYIPDRFEEGYGLNSEALIGLKKSGADLVISVDCGVTAHQQIVKAQKAGLDVIITDHHEPDNGVPKSCIACVNPKLGNNNSLKDLAGVGVAFYLVRALQAANGLLKPGQEKWLLDLVALGTVCDVVPLTGDNRILASFGLRVMRQTRRVGIMALAEKSGVNMATISETDLGFKLGPRLNAAGRLTHAKKALELLVTNNANIATKLATDLNDLNRQRQTDTQAIYTEANTQAKKYRDQPILVLSSPDWSHGVVGIVASRLAEKWHKPTILIQQIGDMSKGSARSYNKFNIIEAIRACSGQLEKFGGHAFAAGVALKTSNLEEFRYRINQYAIAHMDPENNFQTIRVDLDLGAISPNLELFNNISSLSPFGNANPRPLCKSEFEITEIRLVGSDANHLRLIVVDEQGSKHTAIGFGMANKWPWLVEGLEIEMVYELTENVWNNNRNHQLEIVDIRQK